MCLDFDPGTDGYEDLNALAKRAAEQAPHMNGTSEFWNVTAGCQNWPIPASHPQGPIHIDGVPPTLLVGNTGAPATPVERVHSLSRHITGSRVLTYDGDG